MKTFRFTLASPLAANSLIGDRVTACGRVIGSGVALAMTRSSIRTWNLYDNSEIGSRVIIHAGTVIGADGFSFVPDEEGRQTKLLTTWPRARRRDDCEIGANCAIDRAVFGETVLKRGVKLDNFIQVGHNTVLGAKTR